MLLSSKDLSKEKKKSKTKNKNILVKKRKKGEKERMEKSNKRFQGASKIKENNRGITLVALVITIIIIIILAVVAISYAFGENGLIKRAEQAGEFYANDTAYTDGSITNVESYINDILEGTGGNSGGGSTTEDGVPIPSGFYYVGGTKG